MSNATAEQKMKGMVAIVTGSSSGIGAGIAIEFSRVGAKVVITGRKEDKLKEVAHKCQEVSTEKQKPLLIIGDVTNEGVRKKLIEDTVKEFGRLDVLVNNAGTYTSVPVETNAGLVPLDAMLDIHVRVPYHLSKLALPHLIKSKGVIINISSIAGIKPISTVGLEYGVAKAAMDQVTQWFAYELGAKGVRVNSINPGAFPTDLMMNAGTTKKESDDVWAATRALHALGRTGKVEEVSRVAVFLTTQDSSFVTGVNLRVDGGFMVMPTDFTLPDV